MTLSNIKKIAIGVLFFCAVSISLLTPIRDNDFFWHLATGKWIAEHGELPTTDPFAYTTSLKAQEDFYRAKILLSLYWLANLLQYGVFSFGGYYGIIVLRVIIILLTLLILTAHMRKKGLNTISALFLLIPLSLLFSLYKGDRPNQMTYLFAALFMFLADALKRGEKKGYLLPLVLLLWANMHGGFLLGAVIVLSMGVAELLRKMFLRGHSLNRKLVTVLLITLGAGLMNPNGYNVLYSMLFESSAYYNANVTESITPLTYAGIGHYLPLWMLGIPLVFAGWYFISRLFSRTAGPRETILQYCDELMLFLFLAAISFTAIRYIPLFVLVTAPMIAALFSGKFQDIQQKFSRYFVPELLIIAFLFWWISGTYTSTVLKHPPVDPFFPDDAVQFIKGKEMKGRFFNTYDWGGYLMWEFYPEPFVFIDGRGISTQTYSISNAIINAEPGRYGGKLQYRELLNSYAVRHIITQAVYMTGGIFPILNALVNDPEWNLVYIGRNSLVFSRDQIIPAYDKTLSYNLAIANALEIMGMNPDIPFPYLTVAQANMYLGRPQSALKVLEDALQRRPALRGGEVERALKAYRGSGQRPVVGR